MIALVSPKGPDGAAIWQGLCRVMDIVLHLGAHRTGTTTFQAFLNDRQSVLDQAGIAVWGPQVTRKGLFDGLVPTPMTRGRRKNLQHRAEGRVKIRLNEQETKGHHTLLVSDENMLGGLANNLREGELYPAAGERMARFVRAFGGRVSRVVISARGLDRYWPSALATLVTRGHPVANARCLSQLAEARRGWRDVITDVACAMPQTPIHVVPFESCLGDVNRVLFAALDANTPELGPYKWDQWLNRSPDVSGLRDILRNRDQNPDQIPDGDGAWNPFNTPQKTALQEAYADDLFWLAQGADGLAKLTENAHPDGGITTPRTGEQRGHIDDQKGRLESSG